jgi:hypothetical protein
MKLEPRVFKIFSFETALIEKYKITEVVQQPQYNSNGHYIVEVRFLAGALTSSESLSHPQVYRLRNDGKVANAWS